MHRRLFLGLSAALAAPWTHAQSGAFEDETWLDAARSREIPVRLRWPSQELPIPTGGLPVLLFSHGLGGTREGGEVWGEAWARAGFVVVHLQHRGSDLDGVRQAGGFGDPARLRGVAGARELLARLGDVRFALDEVGRRHIAHQGRWSTVRPQAVGLAGHSFGAHTTLGMAGQSYPGFAGVDEPRLAAFIAFSPSLPLQNPEQAFARVTRPLLCITGTLDGDVLGTGASPERRRAVYAALPAGHKAQLVLKDADHMSFAGQTGRAVEILPRQSVSRDLQAAHHALIARLCTDWWRANLQADDQARARLASPMGLVPGDDWRQG